MFGYNAFGRLAFGQVSEASAFSVSAAVGTFTFTGVAAEVAPARTLACAGGAFALTGNAAALPVSMPASTGSFAVTGVDAGTRADRTIVAATGSFTLTGISSGLLAARVLPAAAASFTVSGQNIGVIAARYLYAAPSDMPIADRDFLLFSALGQVAIGQGSDRYNVTFSINGSATFAVGMPAETGAFTLSSNVIDFVRRRTKLRSFRRSGGAAVVTRATGGRGMRTKVWGG